MYVLQYSNFDELERKSEGRLFQHPQGTAADKTSDLRDSGSKLRRLHCIEQRRQFNVLLESGWTVSTMTWLFVITIIHAYGQHKPWSFSFTIHCGQINLLITRRLVLICNQWLTFVSHNHHGRSELPEVYTHWIYTCIGCSVYFFNVENGNFFWVDLVESFISSSSNTRFLKSPSIDDLNAFLELSSLQYFQFMV